MLLFTRAQANVFTFDLPSLPDANSAYLSLYDENGAGVAVDSVLTIDSTATTLAEVSKRDARAVRVASATGIVPGQVYLVGDSDTEETEQVRVVAIQSPIVHLGGGLFVQHALGAPVVATRVTCTLVSALFGLPIRYGRARLRWTVGAVTQSRDIEFAVSEHALDSGLSLMHVRRRDPAVSKRLAEGTDVLGVMDDARLAMNADIRLRFEPFLQRGTNAAYREAHLYKTLYMLAETDRPEHAKIYDARYEAALTLVVQSPTVDHNDDDAVSPDEAAAYQGRPYARA